MSGMEAAIAVLGNTILQLERQLADANERIAQQQEFIDALHQHAVEAES